ncbi:hypothetical protein AK812_SmicGene28019 [Symbiodinium microadriaticum]|uniref:Uncharacterized protein n=2 Tax=Symbiodinium microadriaticum TaxID=2951 RepID=A0A1Q9D5L6_SYMMI|nr:hypothetical protein AK812_SmicGene28019 [Symbiodinium microadriaticum]
MSRFKALMRRLRGLFYEVKYPAGAEVDVSQNFFEEKLVKECNTANYKAIPEPFRLRSGPKVPYTMQMIILPASPPPDCDPATTDSYVHIFKHVYLHRNKANAKDCIDMCFGLALKFDWGTHTRLALMALTYMMDKMGGKQIRDWVVQPKFEKKATIDEDARKAGYRFIREHGLQANNVNQFMEWTDTKIHEAGSPIENWQESKVITALHNYSRGRQNAKTLEYWPFTLKSMTGWFFDGILVHMLGSIRQHGITWIGKTRTGKSLGSKTVAFCQSKYEIEQADRDDLSPAIVTAKHLDFFKSEPVSKFKPAIFDDGMLQKMDASFLKADESETRKDEMDVVEDDNPTGVLTAVYATRAVSLRDLPTDLTVQLMEGHLAAVGAAISAPSALRALALRCFGSLLHRTAALLCTAPPALSEAVAKVVQSGAVLTDLASRLADDEACVASALAAALAEFLRLRAGEVQTGELVVAFGSAARRRLAAATAAAVAGDSATLDEAGQRAMVALPPPGQLLQSGGSLPKRLQLFEAFLAEGSRQSTPLDRSIEITIREDAQRGDAESGLEMALALLAEEVSRLTRLGLHAADSASKRRSGGLVWVRGLTLEIGWVLVGLQRLLLGLCLVGTTLRVRPAASRLLRRLCDAFGQGDDRELWDHTAALLLSWTEHVAGQADVASAFEDEGPGGGAESFKALAKAPGASAEDLLQRICFRISSRTAKEGPALAALGAAAAALLAGLPRTPALADAVLRDAAAAARRLLASAEEPGAPAENCAALNVSASKMTRALYVHLASPLMAAGRHRRLPHKHLADVEGQLLETAACTARAAVARGYPADSSPAGARAFLALQSAANSLLKAIFAAVPSEGMRLPAWTERPHLLADALRPMLEAVYAAPNGTAAVQAAGDVTRLWEVLSQGGSRSTAASAGRSGHTTFQARVQRATMGSALPLIAHALSCERHFAGVEAAARRVGSARDEEAAKWKEAAPNPANLANWRETLLSYARESNVTVADLGLELVVRQIRLQANALQFGLCGDIEQALSNEVEVYSWNSKRGTAKKDVAQGVDSSGRAKLVVELGQRCREPSAGPLRHTPGAAKIHVQGTAPKLAEAPLPRRSMRCFDAGSSTLAMTARVE